jgi:hypothetical protein
MDAKQTWIMMTYRIPRAKTSAIKVALWRKLKKLGVYPMQDSVCLLPLSDKNMEDLVWISEEIIEMGGDASVWTIEAVSAEKEKQIRDYFMDQVNSKYREIIEALSGITKSSELRKQWALFHRIQRQDHLKSPLIVEVRAAFDKRMDDISKGGAAS